ncbi:MAG: hypothetical protein AB8H80_13155 [Planctomycetota bacterium]
MPLPTANDHPPLWIWLPGNTWQVAKSRIAKAGARAAAALAAPLMLAVLHVALAPSVCAQRGPASAIEQLITNDAAARLQDRDPTIRGEAALLVGAAAAAESHADSTGFAAGAAARSTGFDAAQEQLLLEMARQPEPEARHRALIALGLFGSPAAIQHLENILHTVAGRSSDSGVLAAYALGMADPARAGTGPARTLSLFPRGSWKKQHDALTALLLGLAHTGVIRENARGELGSLRRLFDNDANRAPAVRGLLLDLMLPIDSSWSADELCNTLRRGSEQEQLAVLNWLARRPPPQPTQPASSPPNEDLREMLVGIAKRDQDSRIRTRALRALTRIGYLPALDLAARSLRRQSPAECAQGLTTIFAIGGASARGALAQHVRQEKNVLKKAALLDAFAAPPTPELLSHCVKLAIDAAMPLRTRAAAARLVARGAPSRAVPLLRDLFRSCGEDDAAELASIARALQRTEAEPTELRRLLQSPATLPNHPAHWTALLRAGHAGAQRAVLEQLQAADARPEHVATALRAWRKAVVLAEADPRAPEVVRQALR